MRTRQTRKPELVACSLPDCDEQFVRRNGKHRFCSQSCRQMDDLRQLHPIPMPPREEAQYKRRCRQRLLDGVPLKEVQAVYGELADHIWASFTPDERQEHFDQDERGIYVLAVKLGNVTGGWRKDMGKFCPWNQAGRQ